MSTAPLNAPLDPLTVPTAGPATPTDPFEALGMGPDLYDYRGPYRQYLLPPTPPAPPTCTHPPTSCTAPQAVPVPHRTVPTFAEQCALAARAITAADFLLIGAGAGLGVDSGLAAYADVAAVPAWSTRGYHYGTLCRPELQKDDPALFYGFWGTCYNRYMESEPHSGYSVLKRWCTEVVPPPPQGGPASSHWVYSSNVDGHFRRAGFVKAALLELHGSVVGPAGWFCSACDAACGHATRTGGLGGGAAVAVPDPGFRFAVDPDTMTLPDVKHVSANAAAQGTANPGIESGGDRGVAPPPVAAPPTSSIPVSVGAASWPGAFGSAPGWPRCGGAGGCGGLLRPAVHMFGESDAGLLAHLRRDEERYVAWECAMENAVCANIFRPTGSATSSAAAAEEPPGPDGSVSQEAAIDRSCPPRLVILEVGCGLTVPSVRMEMECVLRDLTRRLAPPSSQSASRSPPLPADPIASGVCSADATAHAALVAGAGTDQMTHEAMTHEAMTRQVTMIRINPEFPQNPGLEAHTIAIRGTAEATLREIDRAMQQEVE